MKRCFRCKISFPNSVGDKCPACKKGLLTFHDDSFEPDENWMELINALPQEDAEPVKVYTHKQNRQKFVSNLDLMKNGYRNTAVGKLIEGTDSKLDGAVNVYELAMYIKSLGMWWIKPVNTDLEMGDVYDLLRESDEAAKEEE